MTPKSAKFNVFSQTKQNETYDYWWVEGDTVTSSSAQEDADLPYLLVRVALRLGTAWDDGHLPWIVDRS